MEHIQSKANTRLSYYDTRLRQIMALTKPYHVKWQPRQRITLHILMSLSHLHYDLLENHRIFLLLLSLFSKKEPLQTPFYRSVYGLMMEWNYTYPFICQYSLKKVFNGHQQKDSIELLMMPFFGMTRVPDQEIIPSYGKAPDRDFFIHVHEQLKRLN